MRFVGPHAAAEVEIEPLASLRPSRKLIISASSLLSLFITIIVISAQLFRLIEFQGSTLTKVSASLTQRCVFVLVGGVLVSDHPPIPTSNTSLVGKTIRWSFLGLPAERLRLIWPHCAPSNR